MFIRVIAVVFMSLLFPALAQAQQAYGAPITLDVAKKIIAAAEVEANKNKWGMAIAIVDSGSNLVALHRLDNTQLGSIRISQGKAETALDMRRSTKALEDGIAGGGVGLRLLALPGLVSVQGGLPIVVGDKIIGAIGVSGGTSEQDEQVAKAGLAALGK
jgi:glc operon protein GlcG